MEGLGGMGEVAVSALGYPRVQEDGIALLCHVKLLMRRPAGRMQGTYNCSKARSSTAHANAFLHVPRAVAPRLQRSSQVCRQGSS